MKQEAKFWFSKNKNVYIPVWAPFNVVARFPLHFPDAKSVTEVPAEAKLWDSEEVLH